MRIMILIVILRCKIESWRSNVYDAVTWGLLLSSALGKKAQSKPIFIHQLI